MHFSSIIASLAAFLSVVNAGLLRARNLDKMMITALPQLMPTLVKRAAAVVSIVVPTGYKSSIFVWKHANKTTGVESLIESSFEVQAGTGLDFALVATDVSYVAGFTYPIVDAACPLNTFTGDGVCENPYRDNTTTSIARPWFSRCAGQAWTFPNDTAALSNGCLPDGQDWMRCLAESGSAIKGGKIGGPQVDWKRDEQVWAGTGEKWAHRLVLTPSTGW
ncbi:hypothetical protein B0T14DRAFT_567726 [Immersiella caudata]|uniref:Uncharacterized protein n=1 Tax=Immersiella caudata TaxID=314043 RepID=A0AA39WSZ0_9PEZI|nr:hypothetical protein B0T14DRAFT_567726 [Immersiella caudata]